MQSSPTCSPFEVEEKLLRDSPLEETLQYGEHQQTRVHTEVSNMANLNEALLHLHISLLICCGGVMTLISVYFHLKLLLRQK